MPKQKPKWRYEAIVKKVKDGDTIACSINLASFNQLKEAIPDTELIDVGFSVFVSRDFIPFILVGAGLWLENEPIRFFGLNAPEKNTEQGKAAAKFVANLIPTESIVTIETIRVKNKTKQEKYGRYLGKIFFPDGRCLNDILLEQGLAVPILF
jgi:endonuclease YncB( thermonuclease family)